MRGLGHLRDAGVEFNVLTTLHSANAERATEVYRFIRDDCGARFIQFIPIIERMPEAEPDGGVQWSSWRDRPLYVQAGTAVTGRSISGEQYGRFLIDVFEEWVRHDIGEVYVQMSTRLWRTGMARPPGCACTRRPVARRWPSSTMATSTHVITSSSPATGSATS